MFPIVRILIMLCHTHFVNVALHLYVVPPSPNFNNASPIDDNTINMLTTNEQQVTITGQEHS